MDVIQSSCSASLQDYPGGQPGKKEKIHPVFGLFSTGSDSDSHLLRSEDAKEFSVQIVTVQKIGPEYKEEFEKERIELHCISPQRKTLKKIQPVDFKRPALFPVFPLENMDMINTHLYTLALRKFPPQKHIVVTSEW